MEARAGWYPDPSGHYERRYWDGYHWTAQVRTGGVDAIDPGESRPPNPERREGAAVAVVPPPPRPATSPPGAPTTVDLRSTTTDPALRKDDSRAAVRGFLTDALTRHVITDDQCERLLTQLDAWEPGAPSAPSAPPAQAAPPVQAVSPVHTAPPVLPPPPPSPSPPLVPRWTSASPPPPATLTPPPAPVPRPTPLVWAVPGPAPRPAPVERPVSPIARWWARGREAVSTDLAVHGLAYLGVALIFTGVFGFVVFAFGDVGTGWRPMAELALPIVFFGVAFFLRRRGAPFVSAAMELLGGLVLPIVAAASLADEASVPPDVTGAPMVAVLVVIGLVLAGAYALVVRRRPESPLRYLVAPMVWLAVAALGLVFAPTVEGVRDVSHLFPIQWAMVAVAVSASVALSRLRSDHPIARATRLAAIPGAAVAELLTLVASPRADWPVFPVVLAGIATLATVEMLGRRLRPVAVTLLQAAVLVVTAAAMAPQLGIAWAGAVGAIGLLALAEWQARRRPDAVVLLSLLLSALLPGMLALQQPWPTLAVAGVGLGWSTARRIRPLADLDPLGPIAGLFGFPVLAASGLARLLPPDTTLVVLGASVALVAVVVRLTPARRDDVMAVWVPLAAGAVAAVTAFDSTGRPWMGVTAAGFATLGLLLAPRWACVRVWTTAAAGAVTLGWAFRWADLSVGSASLIAAALATAMVVAGLARRRPVTGHIGLVGHLAATGALAVALVDITSRGQALPVWNATTASTLALVAVGWAATTAVGETWGCSVRDLLIRVLSGQVIEPRAEPERTHEPVEFSPADESIGGQLGAAIAPTAALLATTMLVPAVLIATDTMGADDPWLGVTACGVTLAVLLGARLLAGSRRLLAEVWSIEGLLLTVVAAAVAAPGAWASVAGPAAVVLGVVLVGPRLRREWMEWLGWVASAVAAVEAARVLGVADRSLHLALFGWAAAALIGCLGLDDVLAGRRAPGEWVRRRELRPGLVLGGLAAPVALLPVYATEATVYGWWSLVGAVVAFVVAVQARRGIISTIGWSLTAVAYAALAPWEPMTLPWTLVPAVAVLLGVADLANRLLPTPPLGTPPPPPPPPPQSSLGAPVVDPALPPPPMPLLATPARRAGLAPEEARWDLPPFLVAHATAFVALTVALTVGWVPATWIATGALSLIVAGRLRAWPWAAAGTGMVLVGSGVAGAAWLTLALAVTSAIATIAAVRSGRPTRTALQIVGMLAAGGAWCSLAWWQAWTTEEAVVATAVASGALLATLAVSLRWIRLGLDWVEVWVALPLVGIVATGSLLTSPDVPRSPAGIAVAAALASLALSAALAAGPTRQPWMREAAALSAFVAAGTLAFGVEATATAMVATATVASLIATAAAMIIHVTRRGALWHRPALVLAGLAASAGLIVAVDQLPQRPLLVASLLAVGVDLLGLGLADRRGGWLAAAAAAFTAAWLAFASEALSGDPQWFTMPIGLMVLTMVAAVRWDRRRVGGDPADPLLTGLDVIGMGLLVASSLVQTVSESPVYGLVAVGLGIGLVVFGMLTRVRRRLAFGAATVVAALVLMAVPPLAGLLPGIRGWVPWVLLAAVGLVAILVATFLEQGRRAVKGAVQRFAELTAGWE